MGYCDLLRFETRAKSEEPVSVVEWDNRKLQSIAQDKGKRHTLPSTIRRIARISLRTATKDDPGRFFKVTMFHVHRFHTDMLMNLKALREYLSNNAPVPYNSDRNVFKFGKELEEFLSEIPNYRAYNIYLNGEQIFKPYSHDVRISSSQFDRIKDIKKLTFTNSETGDIIGLGWFAITSFRSSFPKSVLMRGLRVRHGNIEVGDERFLDHIFTERRFATWHVGELHLNHNIRLNARRDGFEESPDYESFLERITFIGKGLSELCRSSSRERSAKHRAIIDLSHVEDMARTSSLVIDEDHQRLLLEKSQEKLESVLRLADSHKLNATLVERAKRLGKKVKKLQSTQSFLADQIDGRKVSHIPPKELLQQMCRQIVDVHQREQPIEKTLEKALKPYLK